MESRRGGWVAPFASFAVPLAATVALVVLVREPAGWQTMFGHHEHGRAELAGGFVCPMRCDNGRTHAAPGKCPRCAMALRALEEAHGDHSAKHGGTLFMAVDGFHHVEGLLRTDREFRLYLYNDFTQQISVTPLSGRAAAEIVPRGGGSHGSPATPLRVAESGQYLWLPVPPDFTLPLEIVLHVSFPGRGEAERFDFAFAGYE